MPSRKIGVDWTESSTIRGAVWVAVFVIGIGMVVTGHGDVEKLLLLGSGVAGALGVIRKD